MAVQLQQVDFGRVINDSFGKIPDDIIANRRARDARAFQQAQLRNQTASQELQTRRLDHEINRQNTAAETAAKKRSQDIAIKQVDDLTKTIQAIAKNDGPAAAKAMLAQMRAASTGGVQGAATFGALRAALPEGASANLDRLLDASAAAGISPADAAKREAEKAAAIAAAKQRVTQPNDSVQMVAIVGADGAVKTTVNGKTAEGKAAIKQAAIDGDTAQPVSTQSDKPLGAGGGTSSLTKLKTSLRTGVVSAESALSLTQRMINQLNSGKTITGILSGGVRFFNSMRGTIEQARNLSNPIAPGSPRTALINGKEVASERDLFNPALYDFGTFDLKAVGRNAGVFQANLLTLAYSIAKSQDQGGRLSDKDVQHAINTIGGNSGDRGETIARLQEIGTRTMISAQINNDHTRRQITETFGASAAGTNSGNLLATRFPQFMTTESAQFLAGSGAPVVSQNAPSPEKRELQAPLPPGARIGSYGPDGAIVYEPGQPPRKYLYKTKADE